MGSSRYSRNREVRRRQEQFEELQWRCDVDYYTPTLADLREAGIVEARFKCASSDCGHVGESFKLTRYWSGLTVREMKKRQIAVRAGGRKVKIKLLYPE
jgi:hypothetical protein